MWKEERLDNNCWHQIMDDNSPFVSDGNDFDSMNFGFDSVFLDLLHIRIQLMEPVHIMKHFPYYDNP